MSRKNLSYFAIGLIILTVIVMLATIFLPQSKKPSPNASITPPPQNSINITPESKRGEVAARIEKPFKEGSGSNITGKLTFEEVSGKVFVAVNLQNAPAGAEYPAFIHFGNCAANDRPKYSLSPVVDGKTENYIKKTMDELKKEFPLSVKVHKSLNETEGYITCAELQ